MAGYPVGTAAPEPTPADALEGAGGRLRRNVTSLSAPEIDARPMSEALPWLLPEENQPG